MPATAVWLLRAQARFRMALSLVLLAGFAAASLVAIAFVASFVWPRSPDMPPPAFSYPGKLDGFEIGKPVQFNDGKYWLVRVDEKRVFALYYKDPHLGCSVPWRETFSMTNLSTGESRQGWFRNPCHGQTYDIEGRCVAGPCVRGLDRWPLEVDNSGRIVVTIRPHLLIQGPAPGRSEWGLPGSFVPPPPP